MEERDLDELPLAVEADDVAVDVVDRDDALLLAHLLDGAELVAVDGGELEAHRRARRCFIFVVELARELVVAALEELRDGVDLLGVPARGRRRSTHGAGQRLIWYWRHGRLRLANSTSLQVRSWKCLLTRCSVRRAAVAEWYGPK